MNFQDHIFRQVDENLRQSENQASAAREKAEKERAENAVIGQRLEKDFRVYMTEWFGSIGVSSPPPFSTTASWTPPWYSPPIEASPVWHNGRITAQARWDIEGLRFTADFVLDMRDYDHPEIPPFSNVYDGGYLMVSAVIQAPGIKLVADGKRRRVPAAVTGPAKTAEEIAQLIRLARTIRGKFPAGMAVGNGCKIAEWQV